MCAGGCSVVAVCNSSNRKRNKPLNIFLIQRNQTLAKEQGKGKHRSVMASTMGGKRERAREREEGGSRKQKAGGRRRNKRPDEKLKGLGAWWEDVRKVEVVGKVVRAV